ncbi:hypothetical protein ABVT39_010892 [Epinephelus coioides]
MLPFEIEQERHFTSRACQGEADSGVSEVTRLGFEGRFGFNTSVSCGKPPRVALTCRIQPDIPDRRQQTYNHNLTSVN